MPIVRGKPNSIELFFNISTSALLVAVMGHSCAEDGSMLPMAVVRQAPSTGHCHGYAISPMVGQRRLGREALAIYRNGCLLCTRLSRGTLALCLSGLRWHLRWQGPR